MILQDLVARLSGQMPEVEDALTEARLMAADLFGGDTARLYRQYSGEVSPEDEARLLSLAARRRNGEPLQHILGEAWFYGRRFISDPRALVPRPETETLTGVFLSGTLPENPSIIDAGTGSGVVGITLALELPGSTVTGTEICPAAASLAVENRRLHRAENFRVVQTDLLKGIDGPCSAIAANLPYIPSGDIPGLTREVGHDPVTALDGGPSGLDLIAGLISQAPRVLASGGLIALEIGCDQAREVSSLLAGWREVQVLNDLTGRPRVVTARAGH